MVLRSTSIAAALGLTLLGWTGRGRAAGLSISPVVVELGREADNAVLTLHNGSDVEERYQVHAYTWSERPEGGDPILVETRDLTVFPRSISLAPGEDRLLRVGSTLKANGREKTYRIFIEELPHLVKKNSPNLIQVRTKIGIPIFIEPDARIERTRVDGLRVEKGEVRFALQNLGNTRWRPAELVLRALDRAGAPVFNKKWDGWYVLAGGHREYAAAVPKEACAAVRTLSVEVQDDKGVQHAAASTPKGACGP